MEWLRKLLGRRCERKLESCVWMTASMNLAAEIEDLCGAYDRLLDVVTSGDLAADSADIKKLPCEIEMVRQAARQLTTQTKIKMVDKSKIVYSDPYSLSELNMLVCYSPTEN